MDRPYSFTSIVTAIILLFDEPEFTQGHYNSSASALYRRCRKENSFVKFDLKTKTYYKQFIKSKGHKILTNFENMYIDQFPDRHPVGL